MFILILCGVVGIAQQTRLIGMDPPFKAKSWPVSVVVPDSLESYDKIASEPRARDERRGKFVSGIARPCEFTYHSI
jgi:hypothetical protein